MDNQDNPNNEHSSSSPQDTSGPRTEVTDEMPLVPYRVLYSDIPFYSDPECKEQVAEATIAVVEALDPDELHHELDVVPTLLQYQPGQLVTWSLNHKRVWEECWYKNPETGQIERAWKFHVEYTGQVISPQAQEQHKETLREIEEKVAARTNQRVN